MSDDNTKPTYVRIDIEVVFEDVSEIMGAFVATKFPDKCIIKPYIDGVAKSTEPTEAQIEAAAQAILNQDEGDYPLDQHYNQHWFRDAAKAALIAASEVE